MRFNRHRLSRSRNDRRHTENRIETAASVSAKEIPNRLHHAPLTRGSLITDAVAADHGPRPHHSRIDRPIIVSKPGDEID